MKIDGNKTNVAAALGVGLALWMAASGWGDEQTAALLGMVSVFAATLRDALKKIENGGAK